jgi:meiosis induction protein kinase IME2/SME1
MVDNVIPETQNEFSDLDKILQNVRYSLDRSDGNSTGRQDSTEKAFNQGSLKRTHSIPRSQGGKADDPSNVAPAPNNPRSRRPIAVNQYETPEEADELLDEVLRSANRAAKRLDQPQQQAHRMALAQKDYNRQSLPHLPYGSTVESAYLTPSPSAKRDGVSFDTNGATQSQPLNITKQRPQQEHAPPHWPTPPYEENEWAPTAASSIFAAGQMYR